MLDVTNPKVKAIVDRKLASGEIKPEHIKTANPTDDLLSNIEAATTLEELKNALLGMNGKAKIKGEY